MMASYNRAILIGNVGQDPETKSGDTWKLLTFSLATSTSWNDKQSGERKQRTEWHRITVRNEHTIRFIESYVSKGSQVLVEGEIRYRKWTNAEGQDVWSTEIVVDKFDGDVRLVGGKSKSGGGGGGEPEIPGFDPPAGEGGGGAPGADVPW